MRLGGWGLAAVAAGAALALTIGGGAAAATLVVQAEDGEVVRGRTERAHAGATGNGYVNYANESGSYVAWVLEARQAGSAQTLSFRYANGAGTTRRMRILLNGQSVGTYSFPSTGSWSTWRMLSISGQRFRNGLNIVRAEAAGAAGGPSLDRLVIQGTSEVALTDWAQALIHSTNGRCRSDSNACGPRGVRFPDPAQLGPGAGGAGFGYTQGLVLLGMHQVSRRDPRRFASYLDYIEAWFAARTDSAGNVTRTNDTRLEFLDTILPGRVALLLHAPGAPVNRYKRTADTLWNALETHERTAAGSVRGWPGARIFWHVNGQTDFVLLDGAYMALPFVVLYGERYGRSLPGFPDVFKDAAGQLIGHHYHLQDAPGTEIAPVTGTSLLYHGYDKQGDARTDGLDWTTGNKKHANVFWARAMGWYAMTLVDVLERFPTGGTHAIYRNKLTAILNDLLAGLKVKQRSDGLWNNIVHHPGPVKDNFPETSSTAMFVYAISKGIQNGYVDRSYADVASRAYQGVLSRMSLTRSSPHLATIAGTAEGQEVQLDNLSGGAAPTRAELYTTSTSNRGRIRPDSRKNPVDNKLHGVGAFLLMYEQVRRHPGTVSPS